MLTTRNVRLDSGRYATKYYYCPNINTLRIKGQQAAWPAAGVQPSQDSPSTLQPTIRNIITKYGNKIPKKALVNQTTNILLLSSTRSGGGFLGQLLNSIFPNMFYAIDPISLAALYQVRNKLRSPDVT